MEIYTDGACEPNPGRGAWAFVTLNEDASVKYVGTGTEEKTTNNRMELTAILEAVRYGKKIREIGEEVVICSDSQYSIYAIEDRIRTKKNMDLISEIRQECDGHEIEFAWVKGHSGVTGNEWADYYASKFFE